jgi:DNA-binding transcriptional LysR family regulator
MCKDHPLASKKSVSLEDISPYGLVLPPRHLSTWTQVDLVFQQHGVPYSVVLEVGGWEVIKRYVEMGTGISIVTSICLRGFENLVVKPMDNFFPTRSYGVVYRRGKFLSPQAKQFLQMMDTEFFAKQTAPPKKRLSKQRSDTLITSL